MTLVATVRYLNEGTEIEVPLGTTILQAAQRAGAPEGYACGGVRACSTCHVVKGWILMRNFASSSSTLPVCGAKT